MSLTEYFKGYPDALRLFDAIRGSVEGIGSVEIRAGKSQVSVRRKKAFAWVWIPGKYLKGRKGLARLVLTIGLKRRDRSPRWKEIVEPYPGIFTHHLEINSSGDIDEEVRDWIREAWEAAG